MSKMKKCTEKGTQFGKKKTKTDAAKHYQVAVLTVIIVKPKHITTLLYFWTIKKNPVNYNIVLSSFLTLEYAWLLNFSLLVDIGQSPSS